MSFITLGKTIIATLNSMDTATGSPRSVIGSSNVSHDNPYRFVLESVRTDLYHFDEEKRVRIIFTIQEVLDNNPPESEELLAVFHRVLEVVQTYRDQGAILNSPAKGSSTVSGSKMTEKPSCARALLQELDDTLKS